MRVSIKIKLILGVIFVSIFVFGCIALTMISQERTILEKQFKRQAIILAQTLNASIGSEETLKDRTYIQNSIYKLMWLNPDIVRVNINSLTDEGLRIVASNNTTSIGALPEEDNFSVIETGRAITKKSKTNGDRTLVITNPIYLAGKTVGTYEIVLSLEELNTGIENAYSRFSLIFIAGILVLALIMLLLFQYLIIAPIAALNKAMKAFGTGDMSYRIKKISGDEIGEVAQGFNQMSRSLEKNYTKLKQLNQELDQSYRASEEKVKERTKELEEAKSSLEVKVKARTLELEQLKGNLEKQVEERTKETKQKINELERVQKVTMGRELRMIELKKEIKKLKAQLQKKENKPVLRKKIAPMNL
jgi:methyl-accepting chemotaxis protein